MTKQQLPFLLQPMFFPTNIGMQTFTKQRRCNNLSCTHTQQGLMHSVSHNVMCFPIAKPAACLLLALGCSRARCSTHLQAGCLVKPLVQQVHIAQGVKSSFDDPHVGRGGKIQTRHQQSCFPASAEGCRQSRDVSGRHHGSFSSTGSQRVGAWSKAHSAVCEWFALVDTLHTQSATGL